MKHSKNYRRPFFSFTRLKLFLFGVLILSGCSSIPSVNQRITSAEKIASHHGWHSITVDTDKFKLRSYIKNNFEIHKHLTIYIEGDGLAWKTRTQVSEDPTPIRPIWLKLALNHSKGNAAYLARPCQYLKSINPNCEKSVWSGARFSLMVIKSTNQAIDKLKKIYGAEEIEMVGFSGGGAVAALVAAERNDVKRLITVAGNLDHKAWTDHHNVTPLYESLNPADFWQDLQQIPQIHFIGENDHTVPEKVLQSYSARFPTNIQPELKVVDDFDHNCCWENNWQKLYNEIPLSNEKNSL